MSYFTQPIIMLDFETTGMSPEMGERVTEVAAIRIVGGEITERYASLINCGVRIPTFITELTGITQSMVNRAPPNTEVIPQLLEFIGRDALAAHNASFDEKFLIAEAARVGLKAAHQSLICSVKLSRRVFPGHDSYSLGNICRKLGIRFNGTAHRAEADAEVASYLLLQVAKELHMSYGLQAITPELLVNITKTTAAKVPALLKKIAAAS